MAPNGSASGKFALSAAGDYFEKAKAYFDCPALAIRELLDNMLAPGEERNKPYYNPEGAYALVVCMRLHDLLGASSCILQAYSYQQPVCGGQRCNQALHACMCQQVLCMWSCD